jgi:hypothetical protein
MTHAQDFKNFKVSACAPAGAYNGMHFLYNYPTCDAERK